MNEQLLKTSGTDVLSYRKKTQKNPMGGGWAGGGGGGGGEGRGDIHSPRFYVRGANNINFLKTQFLLVAVYMIVNLIELNLFLFIYFFNIFYSFSGVLLVSYLRIYNIRSTYV